MDGHANQRAPSTSESLIKEATPKPVASPNPMYQATTASKANEIAKGRSRGGAGAFVFSFRLSGRDSEGATTSPRHATT